jgi:protocatechuate 3,4-dioxygenase beta subunit
MSRVQRTYGRWIFALLLMGLGLAFWRPWSRSSPRTGRGPSATASARVRWPTHAPPGPGALMGLVVDAQGRPAPGARVVPWRRGSAPGLSAGGATTDAAGGFRIEDLAPGPYFAVATADGWVAARSEVVDIGPRATIRLELRLRVRGLRLAGRITDLGGGPVVGAAVRFDDLPAVVSDARGQYALTLPPGGHAGWVALPGYVPVDLEVLMEGATTRDVRLVPGARIAGRVVAEATGRPAAGVEVALSWSAESRVERSDPDGRFDFSELEPGHYQLVARQAALVGTTAPIPVALAETRADLVLVLARGLVLAGRVLDPGGRGVADGRLEERPATAAGAPIRTRTDSTGRYLFEGLLPGIHEVTAGAEGRRPTQASARLSGDVRDLDLVLHPAVVVRGRVVTRAGDPVAGAQVVASLRGPGALASREATHTTEDGTYQLEHLGPGVLTIVARHALGLARFGPEAVGDAEDKTIELVLHPGGAIAGQVRREDGTPAAGVQISAKLPADPRSRPWQEMTGPDGRYRLADLPAGRVLVTAAQTWHPAAPGDELTRAFVDLAEGEEKSGVDLVLPEGGLRIEGLVLAPDGRPLLAASITAAHEEDSGEGGSRRDRIRAYSDVDGRFALEGLHRARYALRAMHPDYQDVRLPGVTANAAHLVIRFVAERPAGQDADVGPVGPGGR